MSTFIFLDENNILSHASNVTMSSINLRNSGSPARAIEFSNSDGFYRHTVEHTINGLQFYTGDNSQTTGTTNILDISKSGLKLVKCDTEESSGHLLINSDGIVKQSARAFTLPTSSGTLALTSDLSNFITTSTLPDLIASSDIINVSNATSIKQTLGLENVENTRDSNKSISSAAAEVHTSLKARLAFLEGFLPNYAYLPLQHNDQNKHYVIQSGNEVMGLRYLKKMHSTGEIGMVYVGSNAFTSSSGGIKWTIQYDVSNENYRFINVEDTNIVLGHNNIGSAVVSWTEPYQKGTASSVYVYYTQLDDQLVTLEATGKANEFYIYKDVGATPTMILICYNNNSTNEPLYADGYGTEDPVIWFNKSVEGDFPINQDLNLAKFNIREYNPNIDP